ncbi:hypothetical protein EYX56_05000 [Escherichia coli]|nr:hypothetical protein [Escherichia coli]
MTFTREEQIQAIYDLKVGYTLGHADIAILKSMARQLLAGMEQEPVAWIVHARGGDQLTADGGYVANAEGMGGVGSTPLYRAAPPAPVSVPECFERLLGHAYVMTMGHDWNKGTMAGHHREKLCQAVEECRAAMLQGAIVVNAPAHYGLRPEQNNRCPAQTPIDHGYRPDCECSGCRGLAAICSGLNGNSPVNTGCSCHACRPVTMNDMRLVVCPECGNKRCPHANDHRHACTGSNEPGQEGSAYPAAPQQEADNG